MALLIEYMATSHPEAEFFEVIWTKVFLLAIVMRTLKIMPRNLNEIVRS
jgi:hypothetical protein